MSIFRRRTPLPPRSRRTRRRRRPGLLTGAVILLGVALAAALWGAREGEGAGFGAPPGAGRPGAAGRGAVSTPRPAEAPDPVLRCLLQPVRPGELACASALLIEARTGRVLYEKNADAPRSPASLVKIMVELIAFEELEAGRLALDEVVVTSANASTMGGSQVYLKHGEEQTVAALLDAIVLASANDAAMALAEHVAGTEEAFVARMNAEARRLGCTATSFGNVHGLDLPKDPRNVTTARDIATMSRALLEHPRALELASTWRKPFRDGEFMLDNTNKLLRRYGGLEGYDGLKTGYTPRAGGCLAGTAERDGVRLVSVILGARPGHPRFHLTKKLLEAGFRGRPGWVRVAAAGERLHVAPDTEPVAVAGGEVRALVEESRRDLLARRLRPRSDLEGPIRRGAELGHLDCRLGDHTFASVPARALRALDAPPPPTPVLPPVAEAPETR